MRSLTFIALSFALAILASGCAAGVTDVSGEKPYSQFAGKMVVAKESGSIWNNTGGSYQIRSKFVRPDSWPAVPSYRTELVKIAEYHVGTKFKIESIKHKKVTSEIMGFDGVVVLCTVYLDDGQRIRCQMPWDIVDPDPARHSSLTFELVDK